MLKKDETLKNISQRFLCHCLSNNLLKSNDCSAIDYGVCDFFEGRGLTSHLGFKRYEGEYELFLTLGRNSVSFNLKKFERNKDKSIFGINFNTANPYLDNNNVTVQYVLSSEIYNENLRKRIEKDFNTQKSPITDDEAVKLIDILFNRFSSNEKFKKFKPLLEKAKLQAKKAHILCQS